MLSVTQLHPSDPEECSAELQEIKINRTDIILCLDPVVNADPCKVSVSFIDVALDPKFYLIISRNVAEDSAYYVYKNWSPNARVVDAWQEILKLRVIARRHLTSISY